MSLFIATATAPASAAGYTGCSCSSSNGGACSSKLLSQRHRHRRQSQQQQQRIRCREAFFERRFLASAASGEGEVEAAAPTSADDDNDDWIPLAGTGGAAGDCCDPCAVRKRVIEPAGGSGSSTLAGPGDEVEIEYEGTIAANGPYSWTPRDVVECWLNEQQGLEYLGGAFLEKGIDGAKLLDVDGSFTEDFVASELGLSSKIQCKKLVMSAKRLAKGVADFPAGTEFDSSAARGKPFRFKLGAGRAIRAMDLAVATMELGERSEIVSRADYAYGKDGLRTSKGDTTIPPFATLHFDVRRTA